MFVRVEHFVCALCVVLSMVWKKKQDDVANWQVSVAWATLRECANGPDEAGKK